MGSCYSEWVRGRTLGRGSSATVSLATSSCSGETFAVKSAELSRSGPIQREKRILSSLCCPHIVSCLGSEVTAEDDRVLYNLFMEYMPGGTLSDVIKRWRGAEGGIDDERVIRSYTSGILKGLSYLHGKGIAHCDVKGQNILIGSDGCVKIADLGCARWVDEDADGHLDLCGGPISGTPIFMAPEVARGEEQGPAADVWALGCTVIEMATGRPPWPDVSDPVSAIHRIAFSADVPEFPSGVSDDAKDFLSRCLKREPKERWSADQLIRHPFVSCEGGELFTGCLPDSKSNKNSPKSTLDQGFWDSLGEEEEEELEVKLHLDDQPSDSPFERLRRLIADGISPSPTANWTRWDESCCWITVRRDANNGGGEECSISSEPPNNIEEDQISIPVADEPTTSGSWWSLEAAVGDSHRKEDDDSTVLTNYSAVVTEGGYFPSNSCYYLDNDGDDDDSCTVEIVVDEGVDHGDRCCSSSNHVGTDEMSTNSKKGCDYDYYCDDDLKAHVKADLGFPVGSFAFCRPSLVISHTLACN